LELLIASARPPPNRYEEYSFTYTKYSEATSTRKMGAEALGGSSRRRNSWWSERRAREPWSLERGLVELSR
jgi:hypothetical protein